jgi:hypothetical protein
VFGTRAALQSAFKQDGARVTYFSFAISAAIRAIAAA